MSLYDSSQFEIDDVGIPITGVAAYAPVTEANIIKDEDLGKATLTLPEAYRRLGLYKEDGGVEEERDDDDAIELFQEGYKLAGKSTTSVKIGLAEDNENVNRLIDGIEPNEHGVVYVPSSLPSNTILLFDEVQGRSRTAPPGSRPHIGRRGRSGGARVGQGQDRDLRVGALAPHRRIPVQEVARNPRRCHRRRCAEDRDRQGQPDRETDRDGRPRDDRSRGSPPSRRSPAWTRPASSPASRRTRRP